MDLKDKTTEALHQELKMLKMTTAPLIGLLSVLLIVCVGGLITKEDNTVFISLIVIPIALSAIIPLNLSNMKKIKAELASRE